MNDRDFAAKLTREVVHAMAALAVLRGETAAEHRFRLTGRTRTPEWLQRQIAKAEKRAILCERKIAGLAEVLKVNDRFACPHMLARCITAAEKAGDAKLVRELHDILARIQGVERG